MAMKVCMFVHNNCKNDARVLRGAKTLAEAGYDVRVIAVLDKTTKPHEERDGFKIVRVVEEPLRQRFIRIAMRMLGQVLPGIDQGIQERGTRDYIRHIIRTYPWRFFAFGWPLLVIYYIYCGLYQGPRTCLMIIFKTPLSLFAYYRPSLKLIKQEPADIYHAHDLKTLLLGFLAARRSHAPLIYDSHELYVERKTLKPPGRLEKYWLSKFEGWLIHKASLVITVNESIAKELAQRYKISRPGVIMNTPLASRRPIWDPRYSLRNILNIHPEHRLILYIGGITFSRGLGKVIEALAYCPNCHFVMMGYGRGKYIDEFQEVALSKGVRSRVSFFGPVPVEEVTLYASTADLGIAPTENVSLNNYYTSPNKVFEYMAAGLPFVASNFPELRRMIESYHLGRTFDPDDPEDIAKAINDVLSDSDRYEQLKRNAIEAAKIFNWENESKKLLAFYRSFGKERNRDA
jgi:glycosyltransferase involved in cell wall biosynthesis